MKNCKISSKNGTTINSTMVDYSHFTRRCLGTMKADGSVTSALRKQDFELILGSSSRPRREVLTEMGYEFTITTADINEKSIRRDKPEDLVMAIAEAKADAIMLRLSSKQWEKSSRPVLLITSDTVVVHQGVIREKPTSEEEARRFFRDYSGSSAKVVGAVFVTNLVTGSRKGGWESAEVYFLEMPDEIVTSLIDEGMIFNVAGGLMHEHPLTLPFVDTLIGSADCVKGLSKALTEKLIQQVL